MRKILLRLTKYRDFNYSNFLTPFSHHSFFFFFCTFMSDLTKLDLAYLSECWEPPIACLIQ